MTVVHDAVQDRICQGGLPEVGVPGVDGQLTANHGGARVEAIVEDLEEIRSILGRQRDQTPVVEYEDGCFGEALEELQIAAVAMRGAQFFEQPRHVAGDLFRQAG